MIENLEDYLVGIVVGIRFRANFTIEDQLGKIVDTILYSNDSFFNPNIFPHVRAGVCQKHLVNPETDDRLTIDNSNFVLEIQFENENGFMKSDYKKILENFDREIIKGVMTRYKIQQILRTGLIKRYLFPFKNLATSFVDKTIGKTLEGVNDINLSFSKKIPTPEAMAQRDVNDWCNAIFNIIKKADSNEIFMSIDYQLYYNPFLEKASEIKFIPFVNAAESFNQKKYLPWLNTNYMEAIDE